MLAALAVILLCGALSPGLAQAQSLLTRANPPSTDPPSPPVVSVSVSPNSITADGTSTATVTVMVTAANKNPVEGDTVTLSSSQVQGSSPSFSPPSGTTGATGTFTSTVKSSTVAGTYTITATDGSVTGTAQLTQNPWTPTHISLSLSPSTITADGSSTSTAIITLVDQAGRGRSGDAGAISLSAPDKGIRFGAVADRGNGTYTASLTSSTVAETVPVTASVAGLSASQNLIQVRGPARTVIVHLAPAMLKATGLSTSHVTVTVADAFGNPVTGDNLRLSTTNPGVRVSRLTGQGNGSYTGRLTSSNMPATVSVIATDASVSPTVSGDVTLTEIPAPSLLAVATMQWSFFYTPKYTVVRSLVVSGAPAGGTIQVFCRGGGCPFAHKAISVIKRKPCKKAKRGQKQLCQPTGSYSIGSMFAGRHLKTAASFTVEIRRRGWIGKYYSFHVRSGKGPSVRITCLAPGGNKPGVGCQ